MIRACPEPQLRWQAGRRRCSPHVHCDILSVLCNLRAILRGQIPHGEAFDGMQS